MLAFGTSTRHLKDGQLRRDRGPQGLRQLVAESRVGQVVIGTDYPFHGTASQSCRRCSPMRSTNGLRHEERAAPQEAIIAQMVDKSASADLRATKMLIDMMKDVEKKAGVAVPPPEPGSLAAADDEVMQQLLARLRRQMLQEIEEGKTAEQRE